jgi:putative FmdB family regulatory protein
LPRYDYRCTNCETEFELVQTFSEAGSGDCPSCGGAGQRVFHAVPVIYKGSGFYTTDYGRPKRPAENSEGKESSSESSSTKSSGDSSENRSSDSGSSSNTESAAPAAAASGDSA